MCDFHIHFSGSRVESRLGSGRWEVITALGGDAAISAGGGMGLKEARAVQARGEHLSERGSRASRLLVF